MLTHLVYKVTTCTDDEEAIERYGFSVVDGNPFPHCYFRTCYFQRPFTQIPFGNLWGATHTAPGKGRGGTTKTPAGLGGGTTGLGGTAKDTGGGTIGLGGTTKGTGGGAIGLGGGGGGGTA